MSERSDTRFSVRIYLNARIRPLVLAACGGVCSFAPPLTAAEGERNRACSDCRAATAVAELVPQIRLGGGFGRDAETNRVCESSIQRYLKSPFSAMFIICSLKSQATHGPFANNRYLCFRTRFPAGIRRHGIKRERLCKSGAIPVAVSSSIRRTLFSHCPDRGREGVRQERARRPALSEHRSRSSGTKRPPAIF